MSLQPFFTIITCTKDSARFLPQNLTSVAAQTYHNFEHLFIDGFSRDQTLQQIKAYQHAHLNTRLVQSPAKGITDAMNQGIIHARGKYLIHLHSDDQFYDPNVLEKVHQFLSRHTEIDWIYGQILTVEADGTPVGVFPRHRIFQVSSKHLLTYFNYIPHQAVFIKTDVFKRFSLFDHRYLTEMDYELWLRLRRASHWQYFPLVISRFRIHSQAESSSLKNRRRNQIFARKAQYQHSSVFERPLIYLAGFLLDRITSTYR